MSRKPIQLEIKGLKTPRERVWEAILKVAVTKETAWDRNQVQDLCNPMVGWHLVGDYLISLESAGYIKRLGGKHVPKPGSSDTVKFVLLKPVGEAPRLSKKGDTTSGARGTEAMWRAMKVLPVFDYKDIAQAATLGDFKVSAGTAKTYVAHLGRAGYLTTVKASKPGVPAKHRLTKNTGMHAPCITRMKVVFDRNTGEFAAAQTPQEVCDGLE